MKLPLYRDTFINFNGIECPNFYTKIGDITINLFISTGKKKSYDYLDDWYFKYPNDRYISVVKKENDDLTITYIHPRFSFEYSLYINDKDDIILKNLLQN